MTLKQTLRVKSRLILWAACLVLVFGAGLVSAQTVCAAGEWCDRDGDGFFRDHRRCRDCLGADPPDCDDNDAELTTTCDGGTALAYTAKLTGAFAFANDNGGEIDMFLGNDRLLSAQAAFLLRPQDEYPNTWDQPFLNACPALGGVPVEILANPDSWSLFEGVRINLVDDDVSEIILDETQTTQSLDPPWELWIQLKSDEDDLVLPDEVGEELTAFLTQVWIWGKPVTKKGRKSDCDTFWGRLETPSTLVITARAAP